MKRDRIPEAVIRRLPRYYRFLDELQKKGVERISSEAMGRGMSVTPSQIRQDLTHFGTFGMQGYGYNVRELQDEIGYILGMKESQKLIVIGAGNLGHALLQNFPFDQYNFSADAAFDVSDSFVGTSIEGVPVLSMARLAEYVTENHPKVAVLTVPQEVAQPIMDWLVYLGVKGFWNFTNVELVTDDKDVVVENIHFSDTLMALSYRLFQNKRTTLPAEEQTQRTWQRSQRYCHEFTAHPLPAAL